MTRSTPGSPILISGAGLAGLLLAQTLKKHSIPFHLYERDAATSYRAQGYRIYLHGPGTDGLRAALTPSHFQLFEQTCAQLTYGWVPEADPRTAEPTPSHIFLGNAPGSKPQADDPNAVDGGPRDPQKNHPPPLRDRHIADRAVLRDVLLLGLEDHISYGKELVRYELAVADEPTEVTVHFRDGTQAKGCMLVGAEGVGSPVRKQLLPAHGPKDTGIRVIYGKSAYTAELRATVPARMQTAMAFIRDTHGPPPSFNVMEPIVFPARDAVTEVKVPEDYVYWITVVKQADLDVSAAELRAMDGHAAADMVKKVHAHWHPSLRAIWDGLDVAQTSVLFLRCSDPAMPPWEPSDAVTVLGDSVHAMPPTGASGAVTALRDAALLGELIVERGVSKETIGEYERQMREYAAETVDMSIKAGRHSFQYGPVETWEDVGL